MRRRLLVAALVFGCALLSCGSAMAWPLSIESVTLDTYASPNTGVAGPVSTTGALANGKVYLVIVSGTWSAWQPSLWTGTVSPFVACGTPEAAPMFPSPLGYGTGPVGEDAETIFAGIEKYGCRNPYPRHYTDFQMNIGSGFQHYDPFFGAPTAPNPFHTYLYVVKGQGQPISFEQIDSNTTDNYGEYHIWVIGVGLSGTCMGGGWSGYGRFNSQNQCTSYFSSNAQTAPGVTSSIDTLAPEQLGGD